ncbi:hypothetical protein CAMM_09055 [Corynebacterium ammoniagenes DSM 20306]|nr:hypothetical protein CAMM_09055 [Corynebacterium ammoniagenes DSM 20306]AQS74091.1 hypothetical protein CA40472_09385 [Corynebacterium ammoniagenes]EFG81994.1 hypothetical protein HMPREF0281_00699 [Corynebacterium ammoniagenes DSM 20306]NMF31308.1 hypothetical protein [Corynebacterium ammoniagenes]
MKIRRILASSALAGVLGITAMTGASALSLGDLASADKLGTELINNASCSDVRGALDALNAANGGRIYNKETTRNELVQNLRQVTGNTGNPTDLTTLAITKYTGQVADRALDCKIVKPNPALPFGSSEVNTLLNDFGPQIFELSS